MEGSRRRGKQRRTWTSDVTDCCGLSYTKCVRMAENRKEWSSMAADLLIRRWHPTEEQKFDIRVSILVHIQVKKQFK